MLIPRTPRAADLFKLDEAVSALKREAEGSDADPFDDAMVAAVTGAAEAMKVEGAELEAVRGRMVRLARQVAR